MGCDWGEVKVFCRLGGVNCCGRLQRQMASENGYQHFFHTCTHMPLFPSRGGVYFLSSGNRSGLVICLNAAEITFLAQVLRRLTSAFCLLGTVIRLVYIKRLHVETLWWIRCNFGHFSPSGLPH